MIYDGAHVLGLIAGRQFQDPLDEGCSILMGSTHKTFFGPQRGVILSNLDDAAWNRIDKAAFPGATSNHHLHTLPPLLVATLEMLAFGKEYARQVVSNARALAASLHRSGFAVECADLGYTESHQVAVNVKAQGGGGKVSDALRENDIITNRNLLPDDPKTQLNNPSGIRLGVQELTRLGMKEPEMEAVARLFREAVIEGRDVRAEVHRFRAPFREAHYSFDVTAERAEPVPSAPVEADLSGY
jgi:glycine hydroxymethyltransferase